MDKKLSKQILQILNDDKSDSLKAMNIYDLTLANKNSLTQSDVQHIESILLELKNGEIVFNFTANIPGADIKKAENFLISSNDLKHLVHFAVEIPGADVERIQKHIIEKGDNVDFHLLSFLTHAPGANIKLIEDTVVERVEKTFEGRGKFNGNDSYYDPRTEALRGGIFYFTKMAKT